MHWRFATAILAIAAVGTMGPLEAQSFEGVISQRTIRVSLGALADQGFDVSEALFDIPIDEILALRSRLEGAGDMTVTDEEIVIKGHLIRTDASDEEGPGYATMDLQAGVVRIVRPEGGMFIEMTQADIDELSGFTGDLDAEEPEIVETGLSRTINGMSATAYDVVTQDEPMRIWVSGDDPELVAAFKDFSERISMMSMGDAPDPTMTAAQYGVPVLVQTLDYDAYYIEEIVSVDRRSVSEAVFDPPAGLQRMTIQDVMGGTALPGGGEGAGVAGLPPEATGLAGLMSAGESAPAWIEYEVTGAVDASGREEDVVMCSETDDGFQARSLGDVIIGLEADGNGEGPHDASVSLSGPSGRFEGRGTLSIRVTGQDVLGLPIYEVDFEGADLESRDGGVVDVQGNLSCVAM
jgi:hypothetical protein